MGRAAGLGAALGATAGAVLVLGVVLYGIALYPFTPRVATLLQAREVHPSVVLTADGVELTRFARAGREWVGLDGVAPVVVDALVATEDRRFYDHHGVDYRRLVGAVVHTLSGDREGGSTLTQQLARNLFPESIGTKRSLSRKLRETITAWKIERLYTKDEILELYLNTVPFLYDAVGIERAAQTYYSTSADRLTASQAAMLVGMLKGTSSYNPRRHPERARARRDLVLSLAVRDGRMEAATAEAAKAEGLGLRFARQPRLRSRAPHFTEHVRRGLEAWARRTGHNLYGDGLTIHTTLDWRMQQDAARSVALFGDALQDVADVEWSRSAMPRLGTTTTAYSRARASAAPFAHFWQTKTDAVDALVRATPRYRARVAAGTAGPDALAALRAIPTFMDSLRDAATRLEVGLVAVEPATGAVKVWLGSRNSRRTPYDHVARARRQPGSTFKPFLYARALEEGWSPDDTVMDDTVRIALAGGRIWSPEDPAGPTGRPVTLRDGLALSKNTVAVRLMDAVGPRDVARLARRAGIESPLDPVPSLALGTSETTLLEMTSAYATLAGAGVHHDPLVVTRIDGPDGETLATFESRPERAMSADVALTVVDMMRGVVDRGTGRQLRTAFNVRGDVAGKTGTTQNGADGWFLMIHPDLAMGAWVGFPTPAVTFRSSYWGQGGHNALRVVGNAAQRMEAGGRLSRRARFPESDRYRRQGAPWDRLSRWAGGIFGDEPDDPGDAAPPPDNGPPPWDDDGLETIDLDDLEAELERRARRGADRAARDLGDVAAEVAREAAREAADEAQRRIADKLRDAVRDGVGDVDPDEIERQLRGAERVLDDIRPDRGGR